MRLNADNEVYHPDNGAVDQTGQEAEPDDAALLSRCVCGGGDSHYVVDTDHIAQCAAGDLQSEDRRGGQAQHFRCLVLERAKQRTGNGTGTGDKGAENADDRGHIRERAAYDVHHKLADLGEHTVESGGVDAGVHHNLYHGYAGDQGDGQIGHLQTGILGDLPGALQRQAAAQGGDQCHQYEGENPGIVRPLKRQCPGLRHRGCCECRC